MKLSTTDIALGMEVGTGGGRGQARDTYMEMGHGSGGPQRFLGDSCEKDGVYPALPCREASPSYSMPKRAKSGTQKKGGGVSMGCRLSQMKTGCGAVGTRRGDICPRKNEGETGAGVWGIETPAPSAVHQSSHCMHSGNELTSDVLNMCLAMPFFWVSFARGNSKKVNRRSPFLQAH